MPEALLTSLGALPIRIAVDRDLATLAVLLREAQEWMDRQKLGQWVPGAHDLSLIETMVWRHTTYVVERDEQIIAFFELQSSLPVHWTYKADSVGYLSTLTVAREFAAHGVGTALIAWAEATLREHSTLWSCLDCYAKNNRLCAYYEQQGYVALGDVETYPGYSERMFQKRLELEA